MQTKKVVPRKNYLRSIQTFTLLIVLVLVAAGVYGFLQYQKLSIAQTALADGHVQLTQLRSLEGQISDQYTDLKTAYDESFEEIRGSIDGVYPSLENYTTLTKTLDDFVLSTNRKTPSIFMNNLRFSHPRFDEDNEYAILPFNLTLSTTRDNFDRFLKYAENSGSIDEGTRLVDIRSISISFPGNTAAGSREVQLLNVSLSLNAYFQLPADE